MYVMEHPKRSGGLGMAKVSLSYCQATTAPFQAFHKETNLWADHSGTLELFVNSDGVCCWWPQMILGSCDPEPCIAIACNGSPLATLLLKSAAM